MGEFLIIVRDRKARIDVKKARTPFGMRALAMKFLLT